MAIDYGAVRTGLAVTDLLRITAQPLKTVETTKLRTFLQGYLATEDVDIVVIGEPLNLLGSPCEIEPMIVELINWLFKICPKLPVYRQDERFTSSIAARALVEGGLKKSKRRDKGILDKVSAVLILQAYLEKYPK